MNFEEVYPFACTSVIAAAGVGNAAALKAFVFNKKPTNGQDNNGWRPLHHAAANKHLDCVKILLKADDVEIDSQAHAGETALTLASRGEATDIQTAIVKCLFKANANPNLPSTFPWKLTVNEAIISENIDVLKLFLKYHVDIYASDGCYGTILFAAIHTGSLEAVNLLLSKKVHIGAFGNYKFTPLHYLIIYGDRNLDVVQALLRNPLIVKCINARDINGATPLVLACKKFPEAVPILLDNGADPDIKMHSGIFPLYYAAENLTDDEAFQEGSIFIKLAQGMSLNVWSSSEAKDYFWIFFIMLLEEKKILMMKYLLQLRIKNLDDYAFEFASSKISDYKFRTIYQDLLLSPLAVCCLLNCSEDFFLLLLEKGSSVKAMKDNSMPPIVALSLNNSNFCLTTLDFLIENGADVLYLTSYYPSLPAVYVNCIIRGDQKLLLYLLQNCVPACFIFQSFVLDYGDIRCIEQSNEYLLAASLSISHFIPVPNSIFKESGFIYSHISTCPEIRNPKQLQHLCVLSVRKALWTSKKVYLKKTIPLLCKQMSLPASIESILFLKELTLTTILEPLETILTSLEY